MRFPPAARSIVYEAIIDDDRSKNAFGLMMSLNMLIETPGGFDYTGADCAGWMKRCRVRVDARRAARRPRLDGRRHQVARACSTDQAAGTDIPQMCMTA